MKKNLLLIGLTILMAIPIQAQNQKKEYKIISEERNVADFDAIDVNGRFKITLFESNQPKVTIVAADEFISTIETTVKNKQLKINMMDVSKNENKNFFEKIKTKYNDYLSHQIIEIHIGVNNLKQFIATGLTSFESSTMLNSSTFYIKASNAAKGELDVNVSNKLTVELSGASKLELEGNTNQLQVDAVGASNLEADDLTSIDATVKQSGASRVEIKATESIDVNLSGATKLVCTGSPKSIKQNASRGSSITIQ